MGIATSQAKVNKIAAGFGESVELRGQAPARAPNSLIALFFLGVPSVSLRKSVTRLRCQPAMETVG